MIKPILMYWRSTESGSIYPERIILSNGEELLPEKDEDRLDFNPLKEYIGSTCMYYLNDVFITEAILMDVTPTDSGVMALHMFNVEK